EIHRQERALLDAGGGVADDEVEAVGGQVLQYFFHAFLVQCVLVAGLRGGQHEQVVKALVLDHGLLQRGLAVDDVDEVVHHAALAAHDQVEVAQAHVEVDYGDFLAATGQPAGVAGAGGGLADAALAGGDYDDFSQRISPECSGGPLRQSSAAIMIWSCSSQTCTALPRRLSGISSSTL